MDFKSNIPIYRQIVDYCFSRILNGAWEPGAKVPSVREMSVQLAVNTHTVLKAYEYLQRECIIEPRRGMGYFLCHDAATRVDALRREEFYDTRLSELFAEMRMLGISIEDVVSHYRKTLPG